MKDGYNRDITYMRLSVTDKCNYNCIYCKPNDFVSNINVLSFDDMFHICEFAVKCGIKKIRLTGGEPLLRDGVVDFCKRLKSIDGLEELTLTTNGSLLSTYAVGLMKAGVSRINISLDTLKKDKFKRITGTDNFDRVIESIKFAESIGFDNIRINVVLIGGFNDDEIIDFIELTKDNSYFIRFIELMPIGASNKFDKSSFISSDVVLSADERLKKISNNGVAEVYKIDGYKGCVGLIRPMTNKFCAQCNRIRVTADGKLKTCLHSNDETDLRGLSGCNLEESIKKAISQKPLSHNLETSCFRETSRFMNEIGG